ncbi:MAG: hypothetical protein R3E42_14870 [Burkholderiaceae bacterium]
MNDDENEATDVQHAQNVGAAKTTFLIRAGLGLGSFGDCGSSFASAGYGCASGLSERLGY